MRERFNNKEWWDDCNDGWWDEDTLDNASEKDTEAWNKSIDNSVEQLLKSMGLPTIEELTNTVLEGLFGIKRHWADKYYHEN